MSTLLQEAASTTDEPLANLVFDYPGADVILRSQDSYHFRVPKIYILNCSPVLGELIRSALEPPGEANSRAKASHTSIPVVQLPKNGEIVYCLLTHIFPVTPLIPATPDEIMELLSVARTYQMGSVLTHIRGTIAQQNSVPTSLEPALRIYALAQTYGLRPEALQAARIILKYPMTVEILDNKLDIMTGASLYELWRYHEKVRAILVSDLTEFKASGARGTITGLRCTELGSFQIPSWLDQYTESIGKFPNLFGSTEFHIAMVRHIKDRAADDESSCECGSIPSQTIVDFWEALVNVVHGSFEKAEPALNLVRGREDIQSQINLATSPLEPPNIPDANLIIRSSDFVNFRVHMSVLALASPFFKDLLSLPQPSDSESVDGLPVVTLSECSELLNSLVSMLYPVPTVIPNSYEKVLYLLAACQKYEMASVQSSIRAKVKCGEFPVPKGAEAFPAYAIASSKHLIPEMENAARQTLDHPMTFEVLGEGLRLFEGWALRDLASFRKRCRDDLVACLNSFGVPAPSYNFRQGLFNRSFLRTQNALKLQMFNDSLDIYPKMHQEYITAFSNQATCGFCLEVHLDSRPTFCAALEKKLADVRDKVRSDAAHILA